MTKEAATGIDNSALATLGSGGLTSAEASRRLHEFGPNAIADETPSLWKTFVMKAWAPLPWMLEAAIVLQIGLGEYIEAAMIGGLLAFNAILGVIQEGRASVALAALKKRLAPWARVSRDGIWSRLPADQLVPGDTIALALGALVPADARIMSGSLLVDQSMLTGEAVPVEVSDGDNVYAGGLVRRGEAIAEVTAIGSRTYFGRTAELVRSAHAQSTEQAAIFAVTRNLVIVNATVAVLTVVYAYTIALPAADLIRLALTALLASIPVALPATFTLSAAISAQVLAHGGVLLTRLSAVHEAAAIDVLCADKTGTLTRNALEIAEVAPMPGFDREEVLLLAALASSQADEDPIDATIRRAVAVTPQHRVGMRLRRLVPFDPDTKMSEAFVVEREGNELRIIKGAFQAIAGAAKAPDIARSRVDDLAERGHRVIAVAIGPPMLLRLAGLIALSDPPREDSAGLVARLRELGVRTVMVTGDSAVTAIAIARKIGIADTVCPPERLTDALSGDEFGVFARVVPEQKYKLVAALQSHGHVVGMCGDGANDAPALRQAQMGIAVTSATDVAKAAAGMVLTMPGLSGIVFAINEGRVAFQRLLTYTFNMLVKKFEIVLFLAIGVILAGHAVMTPVLMVLLLVTNDFLSMSLTTDHASPAPSPSLWRMRNITLAAILLGACKLGFSVAILAFGHFRLELAPRELQTLAFVTLVFGNQAVLYALRERRHMWRSKPSIWVLSSSALDIAIVSTLALSGILMQPLPWRLLVAVFVAAAVFSFMVDQLKLPITSAFKIE
jgi:H+-transporting ATPase